jgi:cleavage and polyadenylation specificity factor subunit 2
VRQFGSLTELQASPLWRGSRPLVVLATGPDLGAGTLSRELLLQWARDPRALVLLTRRPRPGSLAALLAAHAGPGHLTLPGFKVSRRVPLEGAELEAWEAVRAAERGAAAAAAVAAEADAAAAAGSGGAAGAGQGALRANSAALSQLVPGAGGELVQLLPGVGGGATAGSAAAATGDVLMEGFAPPAGALAPMFPDEDEALNATWDVYGELLDVEAVKKVCGGGGEGQASAVAGGRERRTRADSLLSCPPGRSRAAALVDQPPARQAAGAGAAAEAASEEEEPAPAEEEARPTRVLEEEVTLDIAARCALVDYEGRSDGRSLRTIVGQLAPRQLAVVGARRAAAEEMAGAWRGDLARFGSRVVAPGGAAAAAAPRGPRGAREGLGARRCCQGSPLPARRARG